MRAFNFNLDGVWFQLIGTFADRAGERAFDMQACNVNARLSPHILPHLRIDMVLHFVDVLCSGGILISDLETAAKA